MTDDLIARLRRWNNPDCKEAAIALEAKDRRIADLRKEADMMHSEYKTSVARIAELEDGLSSACEYAEKYEAALKRLYDAALDIDVNEMSFTERDWWQTELLAARAAYMGEKE